MWQIPGDSDWIKFQNNHEPSRAYGEEIAGIARYFPDKAEVLEIGCAWAISTLAMLSSHSTMHLTSVDKDDTNKSLIEIPKQGYSDRWIFAHMPSSKFWEKNLNDNKTWDAVYVDGSHLYADCMMDMNEGWRWLRPGGIIFIDDYTHKKNEDGEFGVALAVCRFLSEKFSKEIESIQCTERFFIAKKRKDV